MNQHKISRICHEIHRAYFGEQSHPSWKELTPDMRKNVKRAVAFVLENPGMTPRSLHESWVKTMVSDGWTWGPAVDLGQKQHPNIVPYADLSSLQKEKDSLFLAVCRGCSNV